MSIRARDYRFALSADEVRWCPHHLEFNHCASAFFAALPYLEPYFIHNVREAARGVAEPELAAAADGFVRQEAIHAREHRRFNELLRVRYPGLEPLEGALAQRLARSKARHSLAYRMAYTAGYEAVTYQLVCFILQKRELWLRDANPNMFALLVWHGVEEVEHKAVAYDLFQAIHGGYFLRVRGLLAALLNTLHDIRVMVRYMLEVDGLAHDAPSRKRLRSLRLTLAREFVPSFRHYLKPGYHPNDYADPPEIAGWIARDRAGERMHALTLAAFDKLTQQVERELVVEASAV